jgi:hypothetical protein
MKSLNFLLGQQNHFAVLAHTHIQNTASLYSHTDTKTPDAIIHHFTHTQELKRQLRKHTTTRRDEYRAMLECLIELVTTYSLSHSQEHAATLM